MGTFFVYILKSALCLAAYYLFYKLLMSRDTFHRFNRFALVTLLLCSLVLPLLQFNLETETVAEAVGSAEVDLSGLAMMQAVAEVETPLWVKFVAALFLVYLAGIVFFTLRTIISYVSLWRMIGRCEERPLPMAFAHAKARLMVTKDNVSPFSWMHYVVVNEQDLQENERAILMHELGHIANHHTLDLMLTEVCLIMQWFNPAIWLMREELQAIHEYEADEAVLNGGVNAREYQLLLIKKAAGSRLQSITNSLHQSSIKKRITMMQKKKSNPWARAKYAIAVPVAALSVALFATPTASALSAEISECKVSDLFSVDQENQPENVIYLMPGEAQGSYSLHLGSIDGPTLNDDELQKIYAADGRLTINMENEKPGVWHNCVADMKELYRKRGMQNLSLVSVSRKHGEARADATMEDGEMIWRIQQNSSKESNAPALTETKAKPQAKPAAATDDDIKTVCEVEPEFPGGTKELMKFIAENLRYPAECVEKNIEGRVTLSFIVEKDGSISNIEEMRSPDPLLTEEAKRVLSTMPNWTPGMQDGKAVRVKYLLPVSFRLTEGNAKTIETVKVSNTSPLQKFNGLSLLNDQPISTEELSKLSPDIIESMEVLKDDANISKYIDQYPEAKNGIIKINTKK